MTVERALQRDPSDKRLWGTPYRTIERRFRDGLAEIVSAETLSGGERVDVTILALASLNSRTTTTDHLRKQGDRIRLAGDVLERLRHPNVASVLATGETPDGRPYFVTEELPQSVTVRDLLETGPIPLADALSITLGVLDALDASHAIGVLHRDIKPANVLVAQEGDARIVKLGGFGVAKVIAESHDGPPPLMATTAPAERFVQPESATPEMILGKVLDVRSDVYQVGLLLFEMLAGRAPFETDGSAKAWFTSHLESPPISLAELGAAPPAVSEVVAKALAKQPDERWNGAAAFSAALRSCDDSAVEYASLDDNAVDDTSFDDKAVDEPEVSTSTLSAPPTFERQHIIIGALLLLVVFALGWFAARWAG